MMATPSPLPLQPDHHRRSRRPLISRYRRPLRRQLGTSRVASSSSPRSTTKPPPPPIRVAAAVVGRRRLIAALHGAAGILHLRRGKVDHGGEAQPPGLSPSILATHIPAEELLPATSHRARAARIALRCPPPPSLHHTPHRREGHRHGELRAGGEHFLAAAAPRAALHGVRVLNETASSLNRLLLVVALSGPRQSSTPAHRAAPAVRAGLRGGPRSIPSSSTSSGLTTLISAKVMIRRRRIGSRDVAARGWSGPAERARAANQSSSPRGSRPGAGGRRSTEQHGAAALPRRPAYRLAAVGSTTHHFGSTTPRRVRLAALDDVVVGFWAPPARTPRAARGWTTGR